MRDVLARLGPHLAAEVAAFVHDAGVPGAAAAAVVRGEPTWSFGYGVADIGTGAPLTAATPMRVGSLTKPFVAAAVLRLRDAAALALDDAVVDHLPEFAVVRAAEGATVEGVRVRDLLTHRAGLPLEADAVDEGARRYPTIDEILGGLEGVSLSSPPATAMRYSNLGYQLLGEIVARRADTTFESFCVDAVFRPLALGRTSFDRPDGHACGHRARPFTDHLDPVHDRRKRTNADGGLWSAATDQATWIVAHVDETSAFAEMHGPLDGSDADGAAGQGLGWFRERRDARTLVYHQGSTPGFAARIAFSPALGGGAVVLTNGEVPVVDVLGRIVDLVLDGAEGAVPSEPAPPIPDAPTPTPYPSTWDDAVGFYVWPGSAMAFRLEVRSGTLRLVDLQAPDRPIPLATDGGDRFHATDGGWAGERVTIRRGDDGVVRGLRLGPWSVTRLVEAPP